MVNALAKHPRLTHSVAVRTNSADILPAPIRGGVRASQIPQVLLSKLRNGRELSDFAANETDMGFLRSPSAATRGSVDCDRVSPLVESHFLPHFCCEHLSLSRATRKENHSDLRVNFENLEHICDLTLLAVEQFFVRLLFFCKVRRLAQLIVSESYCERGEREGESSALDGDRELKATGQPCRVAGCAGSRACCARPCVNYARLLSPAVGSCPDTRERETTKKS